MSEFDTIVRTIAVYLIPILFAISLHESAHAHVAYYFGDHSVADDGRLSFNPLRHIDPFGTILLPLLLYYLVHVPFGYGRATPVNYSNLRNPKKHMALVAAAGPVSNLLMGLGWMIMYTLLHMFSVTEVFFVEMAKAGVSFNAMLVVLNLIPVPPFDGGRIVVGLLPDELSEKYVKLENYGIWIFAGLVLLMQTGVLSGFMLQGITFVISFLSLLVSPLYLF